MTIALATAKPHTRMYSALRSAKRFDSSVTELRSRMASMNFDRWENPFTGYGTTRDKTTYTAFCGVDILSDSMLSNLYHGDDTAQRAVNIVPDEEFREGFTIQTGDEGLDAVIDEQMESLNVVSKFADANRWGRAFGGCALLLGADDGRSASQPLIVERAKALQYLYVLDRRYLWPLTWYSEPGHPKLGEPETYFVTNPHSMATEASAIVHESRLIRFGGSPTAIRERETLSSWDYSVLQVMFDTLAMFNTSWKSLEHLLADGWPAVFKMQGLAEALAGESDEDKDILTNRMTALDMNRSNGRMIVVDAGKGLDDKGEDFQRQSISIAGVPEAMDKMMLRLASTVMVPVTIFMGQSPAGMNATGTSDFRWLYDRLRSDQKLKQSPRIRRTVRVLLGAKEFAKLDGSSRKPARLTVVWPPLWNETPLEKAQRIKTIVEADALRITSAELLPEEVANVRGRAGGYDTDIVLSDEALKAREDALAAEAGEDDAAGGPGGDDIQATVLNGSQIESLKGIVTDVAAGLIPRDAAIQTIALSFQVTTEQAEKLLGSAGTPGFKQTPPPAPAGGFGGRGGPPGGGRGGGPPPFGGTKPEPPAGDESEEP